MARSNVEHYNLLNRWPFVMYESPWHWNQISGRGAPLNQPGDEVYVQWERDDVANSINQAVSLLSDALGFFPRPMWYTETIPLGRGAPYEFQLLRTTYGYVTEFSTRTKALITADVAITYSDTDADGIDDTATLTVATTIDMDEIRVYFRQTDGADEDGHDDWEIEPLTLTAAGGVVTITGPRYLFVNPAVIWDVPYVGPNFTTKNNGDTEIDGDFVEFVDVYRVYGDTSNAVGIVSDPIFSGSTNLGGNTVNYGVARITNSRLGHFEVRLDCSTYEYPYPESIQVSYKSGFALRNNLMDRRLEINILRLANALQPWQPSELTHHPALARWQKDTKPVPDTQQFTGKLAPPWGGFLNGEWAAWAQLAHMALGRGGKVTRQIR